MADQDNASPQARDQYNKYNLDQNPVKKFLNEHIKIITLEIFNRSLQNISDLVEGLIKYLQILDDDSAHYTMIDSIITEVADFITTTETVIKVLHDKCIDQCFLSLEQWADYESQKHTIQLLKNEIILLQLQVKNLQEDRKEPKL